ncbi:MAG: hypothetical protein ACJ8E5_05260 [Xanthobacteraceae bacterium]
MLVSRNALLCSTVALVMAPAMAAAASLSVVAVSAPAINCVFETDCTIVVTDSVGTIPIPNLTSGSARLQSRTFAGKAGAPAAGKTGYEYRVDLTTAVTDAEFSCVTDLAVDFGPVTKLQYDKTGPTDHVYVVTKGGLGKIGLWSAEQNGNVVTFTFNQPVCAGHSPNTGDTTFFFGLTSEFAPHAIIAKVGVPGLDPADVKARGPDHPRRVAPTITLERAAPSAAQATDQTATTPNR